MRKIKVLRYMILASVALLSVAPMFNMSVFCAVRPEAYVNRTHGFSINPPSGWTVYESGVPHGGPAVTFAAPVEGVWGIGISIEVKPTSATLDQEVSAEKSRLAIIFGNFTLVSEGSRKIGELNSYALVFTCTHGSVFSPIHYKYTKVLLVERGKAYTVLYGAPSAKYDEYLPAYEESLETFNLLTPEFPLQTLLILIAAISVCVAIGMAIFFGRRKAKIEPTSTCDRDNIGTL